MRKIKAYDCSNSSERPLHHVENMGPSENDVMRNLKKYCDVFNYEFINDPSDADVIITNDVYPKDILSLRKPRVKRMDGVYWSNNMKHRNEPLNAAAEQSDWVIFISDYSRQSYECLYKKPIFPKSHITILNWVDSSVFFPLPKKVMPIQYVAAASNWSRPEKRFNDLMIFAEKILSRRHTLLLIGRCDMDVPPNVHKLGYIDNEIELNKCLNMGHIFINLSYRDPAPKVVCQAVNCRLPILYANSGGTKELVVSGVPICDESKMEFEDSVPRLNIDEMDKAYSEIKSRFSEFYDLVKANPFNFMEMIGSYFWVMDQAIIDYRTMGDR